MITINLIYFRFLWKYVQHLIINHYCTCIEYQKYSFCLKYIFIYYLPTKYFTFSELNFLFHKRAQKLLQFKFRKRDIFC